MVGLKLLEPDRSRPIAVVKIDQAARDPPRSSLTLRFHPIFMGARPSLKVFLSTPPRLRSELFTHARRWNKPVWRRLGARCADLTTIT